jgi:hypothetical protein
MDEKLLKIIKMMKILINISMKNYKRLLRLMG